MAEARITSAMAMLLALTLPGISTEHLFACLCGFAGTMGQGAYQFLTYDKLKPTIEVIIGDMIVSGACGWGVYALGGEISQATVFMAFWAGAGASLAFWSLVKKFRPAWLRPENGGEHQ